MHRLGSVFSLVALAALAACAEHDPAAPPAADMALSKAGGAPAAPREIAVMTRNLYIGADVDAVMAALASGDQETALAAIGTALQTLQRTDFPTRIEAIADEIAANRPRVLGVQEAYQLDVYAEALGLPASLSAHLDFKAALLTALRRHRLRYVVAAENTSTDATLAGGAIHLVDHDLLLVDADHVTVQGGGFAGIYAYNLGQITPDLTVVRGYVGAQVTIDGVDALAVNTHLESGSDPQLAQLRAGQAAELAQVIGAAPRVILTGDFNDTPGSPMYQVLAGTQLTDVWGTVRSHVAGFSCCQAPDLANRRSLLDQRIDYVWTRGLGTTGPKSRLEGRVHLVSNEPSARVRGRYGWIWPSDHAGLVAELQIGSPRH